MGEYGGHAAIADGRGGVGLGTARTARSVDDAGVAQAIADTAERIRGGAWAGGLLDVATASAYAGEPEDPLKVLLDMGFGWVIEHLAPLTDALDWLIGDRPSLDLTVSTWEGIGDEIRRAADELSASTRSDCAAWPGPAADRYRTLVSARAVAFAGLSAAAEGLSLAVSMSREVLDAVHSAVRSRLAGLCAEIITILSRYPRHRQPVAFASEALPLVRDRSAEVLSLLSGFVGATASAGQLVKLLGGQCAALAGQFRTPITSAERVAGGSDVRGKNPVNHVGTAGRPPGRPAPSEGVTRHVRADDAKADEARTDESGTDESGVAAARNASGQDARTDWFQIDPKPSEDDRETSVIPRIPPVDQGPIFAESGEHRISGHID